MKIRISGYAQHSSTFATLTAGELEIDLIRSMSDAKSFGLFLKPLIDELSKDFSLLLIELWYGEAKPKESNDSARLYLVCDNTRISEPTIRKIHIQLATDKKEWTIICADDPENEYAQSIISFAAKAMSCPMAPSLDEFLARLFAKFV